MYDHIFDEVQTACLTAEIKKLTAEKNPTFADYFKQVNDLAEKYSDCTLSAKIIETLKTLRQRREIYFVNQKIRELL